MKVSSTVRRGLFGKGAIDYLARQLPYTTQLLACDAQIQRLFSVIKPRWDADFQTSQPPLVKRKKRSKNAAAFDGQAQLLRITGVDLAAVSGLNATSAQTILSEIGTDMSKWPTVKHFASWLGLAPHNDISGGRVLRSRTLPTTNRAGQAFRQAAASVARSSSAFGAYYRRKKAQGGPLFAQVATAHKIARTVYSLLKYRVPYVEMDAASYEQKQREREVTALRKKAARLGFVLAGPDPSPGVN